jgi:hypothetical protein
VTSTLPCYRIPQFSKRLSQLIAGKISRQLHKAITSS